VGVATIRFGGAIVPVTWTSLTNWTATLTLQPGTHQVSITGYDLRDVEVPGATTTVTTTYQGDPNGPLPFAAGNLAVLRVGDGTETLGSHGNSVFLDQFTTNGVRVDSFAVPNSASNALILSGSASSEGALTRSADGRLLVLAGYHLNLADAAVLGSSLANADAVTVPRALGVMDAAGDFALVGVTTNQYGGNNMRAGTTDGLGNYWGAGGASGTCYLGDGLPAVIQTAVKNTTVVQLSGGNLCFSTSKTTPGLWRIPGAPTVAATPELLFSSPTGKPYAFAFNPAFTTAYVADDTISNLGGLQRWDFTNGAWSLSYAFAGVTNRGARGLAVDFSGTRPVLFATTAEDAGNQLISLTDNGASSPVVSLATAGSGQLFRGVALAPVADPAPKLFAATPGSIGFNLAWTTRLNRTYALEYTDDLAAPNWQALTNVTATGPVLRAADVSAPAAARFYRVRLAP
jgi:hypothetical protein